MRMRPHLLAGSVATQDKDRGVPSRRTRLMRMLKKLIKAFEVPPRAPTSVEVDRERLARGVVRDRSHGNVLLQEGKYYTQQDVDKEYERVRAIDFGPRAKSK